MSNQILFIQGGGEDGYAADKELVASLKLNLGKGYTINYPALKSDESVSDFGWPQQIRHQISEAKSDIILVGHSLGASMILKCLSENSISKEIVGVFLIATPFWDGDEDWVMGLKLQENFAAMLPDKVPIFLYHCEDDEEVPFSHLKYYKQKLTSATIRVLSKGGHQFNNDLTLVANDIKALQHGVSK